VITAIFLKSPVIFKVFHQTSRVKPTIGADCAVRVVAFVRRWLIRTLGNDVMDIDAQTVLIVAIVGLVAGWLAVVVTGSDLTRYLAAGIAGAFVGKVFLVTVHFGLPIDNALVVHIVSAAVGALIMIALTRIVAGA